LYEFGGKNVFYFIFLSAVTKPAVEERKKFYDAEGLGVDLYSRSMYTINDHFSCFYYHHFTTT
jgi:hypothetical protein